jgi:hypothetical protein
VVWSAAVTGMVEPVTAALVLQTANSTVASHWRRPGDPWRRVCLQCTDTACAQLEWAENYLIEVRRKVLDGRL